MRGKGLPGAKRQWGWDGPIAAGHSVPLQLDDNCSAHLHIHHSTQLDSNGPTQMDTPAPTAMRQLPVTDGWTSIAPQLGTHCPSQTAPQDPRFSTIMSPIPLSSQHTDTTQDKTQGTGGLRRLQHGSPPGKKRPRVTLRGTVELWAMIAPDAPALAQSLPQGAKKSALQNQ